MNRTADQRSTSTAAHAAMLRSLAPWTRTLADAPVAVTGLQVHDHKRRFTVQLLSTAPTTPTRPAPRRASASPPCAPAPPCPTESTPAAGSPAASPC
ncbi:MAG: hypothetical protein JO362_14325 [Streptomycetaceae bacterium]|nr:hypothetical protein [Streptomycetaceae bacterium]